MFENVAGKIRNYDFIYLLPMVKQNQNTIYAMNRNHMKTCVYNYTYR